MKKQSIKHWKKVLVDKCVLCNGRGVIKDDGTSAVEVCKCMRMVRYFVKMNDPEHGLRPQYHGFTLDKLDKLSSTTTLIVKKYLDILDGKYGTPYRNAVISSEKGAGKSSIAAVIYKHLMCREYNVSVFSFNEIISIARDRMANSQAFNERKEVCDLLREEDFIIIENVDNRGDSADRNFEKVGMSFLDEIFSYRANHPSKATIVTVNHDLVFSHNTMGRAYFSSIYKTDVEDDKICKIELKLSSKSKENGDD
jgi:hypothetical protein